MRRTLLMIAAFALLLTQCRKPAVELPTAGPANENMVSMTVTVGHGGKTDINGTTGAIIWSAGDKLYVGDGSKYIGCLTLQGAGGSATGTFSGSVSATESTDFGLYYLGSKDYTSGLAAGTSTYVDIPFASQTGLIGDLDDCHIGYGTATGKVEGGSVILASTDPVTMTSKVAIAYFEFKKDDDSDYTGAITLSGTNIYNKMTVKFSGAESDMFTGKDKGGINLTSTSSSKKYVMLVPTGTGEETLEFVGGYEGTTTLYKGIEANKFYCVDAGNPIAVKVKLHETVNFDTPDLNWSKYNLGATNGETAASWYGDYYAWGETAPYIKNGEWCTHPSHDSNINFDQTVGYGWKNYLDGNSQSWKASLDWIPYDATSKVLTSEHDAATKAWGDGWRMPTKENWDDLYKNNTFEWLAEGTTSTEVPSFTAVAAGYLVVKGGKNGIGKDASVYMFLPAAGSRSGTSLNLAGSGGGYWSSSLDPDHKNNAFDMFIISAIGVPQHLSERYNGYSVRPVR